VKIFEITWEDVEAGTCAFAVWSLGFFFLCVGLAALVLAFRV